MAEEYQAEICGATWWNPTRGSLLSPCSGGIGMTDHIGSFGWSSSSASTTTATSITDHHHHHHMVDMKAAAVMAASTTTSAAATRSCEESNNSVSGGGDCSSNMVFQGVQKNPHQQLQTTDSDSTGGSCSPILIDSTLQIMNFGLSSSTASSTDWNPALVLEDMNAQIQKDWGPSNMGAAASYGYPSTLLQTLFEPEPLQQQQQQQQSLFNNRPINSANYMSGGGVNYGTNVSNDIQLSPTNSWPKNITNPLLKPSLPKHQPTSTGLHFSNNTTFWNAAAATPLNDIGTTFFPSSQSHFLTQAIEEKPSCTGLISKLSINGEVRDTGSVGKKGSNEPAFKRPRIETPSPLPTFKVRKEKLGDRITALQQLVSPFGKTDTASVLHEAIDYIKFLHEQVNLLSTPYMKQGTPSQQQQSYEKLKDPDQPKQDLRSRGLCLVPTSSTYPVANETTADLWTQTCGGTFR